MLFLAKSYDIGSDFKQEIKKRVKKEDTFETQITSFKYFLGKTKKRTLDSYKKYLQKQNDLSGLLKAKRKVFKMTEKCNALTGLDKVYEQQKEEKKRIYHVQTLGKDLKNLLSKDQKKEKSDLENQTIQKNDNFIEGRVHIIDFNSHNEGI